jgi:acetylglutamate kinase
VQTPEIEMKPQTVSREEALTTARLLSETLPHLLRFSGAVVVVKFGGNAMGDDAAMAEFARDIVLMRQVGVNPVVVHGGGPMINDMLTKLGITSEFVRGKRVTDKATVQVVEMILSGLVNKRIVHAFLVGGGRAVGSARKKRFLATVLKGAGKRPPQAAATAPDGRMT